VETAAGEVIEFLQSDLHAREVCGHADSLNSLCDTTGIARGTLRYQIDNDKFSADVRAALARSFDFAVSLLDAEPEVFKRKFGEKYRDAAAREAAKQKVLEYRKSLPPPSSNTPRLLSVSRPRRFPPADDLLASLTIGANQAGPDQPWPLTVELVCRFAPVHHVVVGVRRGKLVIDCGQTRTTGVHERLGSEQDGYKPDGSKVTIFASGDDKEPVWLIDAESAPIGVLRITTGICQMLGLVPGTIITADFRAYLKDLEAPDDSSHGLSTAQLPESPSYSFIQPELQGLESRAKIAILTRLAELQLPEKDGWVVLHRDELQFDDATDGIKR